jgi:hypothetical protein
VFCLDPPTVDQAVELVVSVAAGDLEVAPLGRRLASWARER